MSVSTKKNYDIFENSQISGLLPGSHLFGRNFLSKFSMNILFGRVCCWGSHFLMLHYIAFMSFIEFANLLN